MKKSYPSYLFRFFTVFCLSIPIVSSAQVKAPENTIISLNATAKPLAEVLKTTLKDILAELTNQLGIEFNINGAYISIRRGAKAIPLQSRPISGLVTDAKTGGPVPGVNIYIKGTKKGAVTDANGTFRYKLNAENIDNIILTFNFIGMKAQEIRVGKENFFNIKLEDDIFGMDEVVVTGSYTKDKRREDVVGSISQITAERLQTDRPIESFDKMLEGMVAGVLVETTTELNTPVKINIRGQGSFPTFGTSRSTSTQPLFVIDGIPSYEQQKGTEATVFNSEDYLNPLSNINSDDIMSISVLKDATASALYGANAANGVIIITTKGGYAGKTKANFSYDTGISGFINEYKWLNGPQYYSLLREMYINGGRSVTEASQNAGSSIIDTDWFDLTQRNAIYQNAGFDLSGGTDKTTFRFSSGYRNQQANYPETGSAPNPDLGWEKNNKLNFGLDFTLFKRINFTAEYYNNTIHDLISAVNVPLETGYATISANTGKMRNSGFELSINW